MKRLAVYLVDQDRETTSSIGIFNFSRNLVLALAEAPEPGFRIVLWVSSANRDDFTPPAMPFWLSVRVVNGRFGTGWRRIWADQALAPCLEWREKIDAVHYPKGWMPFVRLCRARRIVTLHDTIVQYYRSHYPGYFSGLKVRYFDSLARQALRKADLVHTSSRAGAAALAELGDRPAESISVVPTGLMRPDDAAPETEREGLLVVGSKLPHKATAETLRLLEGYCRDKPPGIKITVAGIQSWDDIGGRPPNFNAEVDFAGRVADASMRELMQSSRALVFLSEIEGFGLPVLESYAVGTPVCYRNAHSVAEVLDGAPGAWDGRTDESFRRALDETLAMQPEEISRIQNRLRDRYGAGTVAQAMIEIYRAVLSA